MRIEALIKYFENYDEIDQARRAYSRSTDLGLYQPSNLVHINGALSHLIEDGVMDTSKPFLDTGSGDGRVVALASMYGMAATGIEYDADLTMHARDRLWNAHHMGLLGDVNLEIINDDFMNDDTYHDRGLKFEDFGIVFNYITRNFKDVAAKVAGQSKPGTVFLLYGNSPYEFEGLKLERSLNLVDRSKKHPLVDVDDDSNFNVIGWEPETRQMQVYRK